MAKHTPGPWKWNGQAAVWGGAICICKFDHEDTDTDEYLPKLGTNGAGWTREQARANARLIAAAPELLDACMSAREWLAGWASAEPFISILDVAIAKATEPQP